MKVITFSIDQPVASKKYRLQGNDFEKIDDVSFHVIMLLSQIYN